MEVRTFFRRMTYVILALFTMWLICVQSGCFSMRITDKQWAIKLSKAGQSVLPQFINIQSGINRTIHAIVISAADSLPLTIMVHGSPGGADGYLTYLADTSLSKVMRMVAIDRPGFGFTSGFGKPEPSMEAQAAAVKTLADHLSPGRKVLLMGHSLGGPIIARFAMDYPELTAGLVVIAGSIDPTQEEHPWWQTAGNFPVMRLLLPKPMWASNAEITPLEKELEKMLPLWDRITHPVRIIHAADDRLVPVANVDFARRMLKNCLDLKVELLPKGDHFILWSRQDVIRKAMLDLL